MSKELHFSASNKKLKLHPAVFKLVPETEPSASSSGIVVKAIGWNQIKLEENDPKEEAYIFVVCFLVFSIRNGVLLIN